MYLNEDCLNQTINPLQKDYIQTLSKPTRLLRKPLEGYFEDRLEEHVNSHPLLAALSEKPNPPIFYSVASEEAVARQEIDCLNDKLAHARSSWIKEKKEFDIRWDIATKKQNELVASIPSFNPYYLDQFVRRERAERALEIELAQTEEREKEILASQRKMQTIRGVQQEISERLEKFENFRFYIDHVLDSSNGTFKTAEELEQKYSHFLTYQQNLEETCEKFRNAIFKRQAALDRDKVTKSTEILTYRNYLTQLLQYDADLMESVHSLEEVLTRIRSTAATRTIIIGQIKMSIYNIYRLCCKVLHRHAELQVDDYFGQLIDIEVSFREITRLGHDIKRMMRAAFLTAKQEAEAQKRYNDFQEERERRREGQQKQSIGQLFGRQRRKEDKEVQEAFDAPATTVVPIEVKPLTPATGGTGSGSAQGKKPSGQQ